MPSPQQRQAREADRVANLICRRRLTHAALALAAAWLTYVNPFTLQVRTEGGWVWLGAVIGASFAAMGFALWSITAGDRRAWMRAFEAATHDSFGSPPTEV